MMRLVLGSPISGIYLGGILFVPSPGQISGGNKVSVDFWKDSWAGEHSFSILFPRLYHLSSLHSASISDFMIWEGRSLSWNLHFRRNLQNRGLDDLTSLLGLLDSYSFSYSPDDRVWLAHASGVFSWNSFYKHLLNN